LDDGKKLSGIDLHDFGTTFKAYRREIIPGNSALPANCIGLFRALASSTGRKNSGTADRQRRGERRQKRYGIARTIRVLLDLIIVKFLLDYSDAAWQIFGLVGVGSTALSVLLWLVLAFDKFYFHIALIKDWARLMFLAVALFLVGIQLFPWIARRNHRAHLLRIPEQAQFTPCAKWKSHRKEWAIPRNRRGLWIFDR